MAEHSRSYLDRLNDWRVVAILADTGRASLVGRHLVAVGQCDRLAFRAIFKERRDWAKIWRHRRPLPKMPASNGMIPPRDSQCIWCVPHRTRPRDQYGQRRPD